MKGAKLAKSVSDFRLQVLENPVLLMTFRTALEQIPENGLLGDVGFDEVFDIVSHVTVSPPKFYSQELTGIPFYAIFVDFLDNRWGQSFFSNPIVNNHLKNIFDDYRVMLKSQVSNTYMNDGEGGWFSKGTPQKKGAACFYDFEDYYIYPDRPNFGFASWNDWFIRSLREGRRPIDLSPDVIIHSSESEPLYYPPNF